MDNERTCGNSGDEAGVERGEDGWRGRSGRNWFAESRQAKNSGSEMRSSSRGRAREWNRDGHWARTGMRPRDFGSCRWTGLWEGWVGEEEAIEGS